MMNLNESNKEDKSFLRQRFDMHMLQLGSEVSQDISEELYEAFCVSNMLTKQGIPTGSVLRQYTLAERVLMFAAQMCNQTKDKTFSLDKPYKTLNDSRVWIIGTRDEDLRGYVTGNYNPYYWEGPYYWKKDSGMVLNTHDRGLDLINLVDEE